MSDTRRITILWQKSKDFVQNLNIFPSLPPSTDENELRIQRMSTRLFIFLWIFSMTVLLFYTSLIIITKTITVETPSFAEYSDLISTYNQTLVCPCSNISITHDKFIRVEYTLHQVCTSIFVHETWIDYLSHAPPEGLLLNDFRRSGVQRFQTIRMLCELGNNTILNSVTLFNLNQYVSAIVVPQELFKLQIESLTDKLRSSMTSSFSLSLAMFQEITQANSLYSLQRTNYDLNLADDGIHIILKPAMYSSCHCSVSSKCTFPISFTNDLATVFSTIIPNFYLGCYIVNSLLQSTLECFYNESCFDKVKLYITSYSPFNVSALNVSLPSRYSVNSTIQKIVDDLMIEKWHASPIYERYYNECKPIQCTYEIDTKNDIIYIVTTLFGLVDGLTTVLKFVVPRLVEFVMYYFGRQRITVVPETVTVET